MAPGIIYTSCVLGAIALYVLLIPGRPALKPVGIVLGLGALGWVFKASIEAVAGGVAGPGVLFYVFSAIAIAAAVRMITHTRPVYAALYFVMVVLSSAALFLLLEAEFMAFALIIVYAGAILITYLFVLMLAQQAPQPGDETAQPDYDVFPREPAAAVTVGFVMLALLGDAIVQGVLFLDPPAEPTGPVVSENIERVGLALVGDFPVSLELAGVILLMAMYGAVVLARRQMEMSQGGSR
jgi:NADH-quinone oxidoreductase subunit J